MYCNHEWQRTFGGMVQTLLAYNQNYQGKPCPPVKFL